jgi:hypothetical protein
MRAWSKHISDQSLWPNERLFFELYGQALQRRPHTTELLDGIVEDWLAPIAEINIAIGVPENIARAHPRLGIAVTRGLLLDLLATRAVAEVDAAMDAFIELYEGWLTEDSHRSPCVPSPRHSDGERVKSERQYERDQLDHRTPVV